MAIHGPDARLRRLVVVDHPLAQHKVGLLREASTTTKDFRHLMGELAAFLTYEATRDLELEIVDVLTPLEPASVARVSGKKLGLVVVLRAGLGMLDAVVDLVPVARVGFVGMYRDEATLEPVEYYCKLPGDLSERHVLVLDPMLATGGSAAAAIGLCKQRGAVRISLLSVVCAPQGIERVHQSHPEVSIYTAAVDRGLNGDGYILPGLGDAGDRLFGTR
jgi:uracil phosphoribosyltransferase